MCNHNSGASTRQPAEFLTGHALQIAPKKRGVVGICARGYAPQKTPIFKDQRANYMRGDAPFDMLVGPLGRYLGASVLYHTHHIAEFGVVTFGVQFIKKMLLWECTIRFLW